VSSRAGGLGARGSAAGAWVLQLPAHGTAQLAGDGQAQAGATQAALVCGLRLLEGLEDAGLFCWRDAHTGVFYGQHDVVAGLLGGGRAQDDLAMRGELDGVADQVVQHLAQAHGVAHHEGGAAAVGAGVGQLWRRVVQAELQALVLSQHLAGAHHLVQQAFQVEGLPVDGQAARLQAGEIEHVVDDAHQVFARALHQRELALGFGVQLALADQAHQAQDAVHGGAHLVAHGGQETALGFGVGFGLAQGFGFGRHRLLALHAQAQQLQQAPG